MQHSIIKLLICIKNFIKKTYITLIITYFFFISCTQKELTKEKLVGKTFPLDTYHKVEFKTETTYRIYQQMAGGSNFGCLGEGSWSIQNGKIMLNANNSNCGSTREMKGVYEYSMETGRIR